MTTSTRPSLRATPPRNAIEMPLHGFLRWGVWAPPQVLLSLVSRDLDDRLAGHGCRVVAIDREVQEEIDPQLEYTSELPAEDLGGVGLIIENLRPRRRGPRRAIDSMQLIIDIGVDEPDAAIASMLLWRDLAIEAGHLLADVANPTCSVYRRLERLAMAVRKQRQRIRAAGWTGQRWIRMPPPGAPGRRIAAVVGARAAAARCGAENADALLDAAFKRYAPWDDTLREIELPEEDLWGYHPTGRELAKWFVKPGGRLYEYNEVLAEVRQRAAS